MTSYRYERLTSENLHHLIILYGSAFNLLIDINYLHLKYNTRVLGAEFIGYLAIAETGMPAAYYGLFPMRCQINGKEVLCAQSGDTMTHGDHRGKGLFVELARRTYALAREEGIKFVFGFPNQNSYPGFVKRLNWTHKVDLNLHAVKIPTFPLAKLAKKVSFLQPIYRAYVHGVALFYPTLIKGFRNSLETEGHSCILHNSLFFDYKKYSQTHFLKIRGKGVWIKIDGRLWIGDIEHQLYPSFEKTISSLKIFAFLIGANEIHFHTHPGTSYDNYMSTLGKVKSVNPVGFLDLDSGLDIGLLKFQSGDFDTF